MTLGQREVEAAPMRRAKRQQLLRRLRAHGFGAFVLGGMMQRAFGEHQRLTRVVGVERTTIEWTKEDDKAYAKRGDGKGEVEITFVLGSDGKTPVVINNLTYFGAKKNNGFHLARSKHHAKVGEDSFEFDGRTGFFIGVETSGTVK